MRHLAVLDIVPTLDAWDLADARFAEGYWPWSLLAQPEPLPERLLAGAADRQAGRRIACPVLVLWSADGPLGTWYAEVGGQLGVWRRWADDVRGDAVPAGHFFPEEMPDQTAGRLRQFLGSGT